MTFNKKEYLKSYYLKHKDRLKLNSHKRYFKKVQSLILSNKPNCLVCGKQIGLKRRKLCSEVCLKRYSRDRNYETRREKIKEYYENNKEKAFKRAKLWIKNNPDKVKIQKIARQIKKDKFCIICKSTDNLHKHHPDYRDPLTIITLCAKCHRRLHNGSL